MSDLTISVRQAQAEAKKYMAESIQSRLRVELSASITGSNKGSTGLQRHLSDSIASVVDGVIVSGVVPEEIYWEKIAVKPAPKTVETKYNTYVLIQIPVKEYEKAKILAAQRLVSGDNTEAREAGRQILQNLREKE